MLNKVTDVNKLWQGNKGFCKLKFQYNVNTFHSELMKMQENSDFFMK